VQACLLRYQALVQKLSLNCCKQTVSWPTLLAWMACAGYIEKGTLAVAAVSHCLHMLAARRWH
jgi:hypothetical protein